MLAIDIHCSRLEKRRWRLHSPLGSDSKPTTGIYQDQTVRADRCLMLVHLLWQPKPLHISSNWWLSHSAFRLLLGDAGLPVREHSYNPLSFVCGFYKIVRFIPDISSRVNFKHASVLVKSAAFSSWEAGPSRERHRRQFHHQAPTVARMRMCREYFSADF